MTEDVKPNAPFPVVNDVNWGRSNEWNWNEHTHNV